MKKENYSDAYFEGLATEQLEEMIDLGLELPSRENKEALLHILEVLERRENETMVDKAWEEFQQFYAIPEGEGVELYEFDDAAMEEKEGEKEEKKTGRKISLSRVWAVGRVAAATVVLTLGTMVFAQAAGVDVFGAMGQWTDENFRFDLGVEPTSRPLSEEEAYVDEFQRLLRDANIPVELVPTWYPEGFVPGQFDSSPVEGELESVGCVFDNEEEDKHYAISVDKYYNKELLSNVIIEKNDEDEVEQYVKNGRTFYIMLNNPGYTGAWSNGELLITVGGNLTKGEVKKIINSIGE